MALEDFRNADAPGIPRPVSSHVRPMHVGSVGLPKGETSRNQCPGHQLTGKIWMCMLPSQPARERHRQATAAVFEQNGFAVVVPFRDLRVGRVWLGREAISILCLWLYRGISISPFLPFLGLNSPEIRVSLPQEAGRLMFQRALHAKPQHHGQLLPNFIPNRALSYLRTPLTSTG